MSAQAPPKPGVLAGVRLGELERTLLMAAPPLGTLGGLLIDAPEDTRSAQQGYLRAAKKLEAHRLIKREHVREATRAYDPRRERPLYHGGRFWIRAEASRRHLVRRVVIWATQFGEGIRRTYERELTSGRPIRWTARKIALAERFEAMTYSNPTDEKAARDELQARLSIEEEPEQGLREVRPKGVLDEAAEARWLSCVAIARREHPKLGSGRLWEAATKLFGSDASTRALVERASLLPQRPPDRPPLRFRRHDLGMIIPTERRGS